MVFIEQVFERNPCVGLVLYLLHNLAERMAGYRVTVSLQFIRKVYIGSVNMTADFEIHNVHIGKVLIHDKAVIFYPYILFVDIFDFR